MKYIFILISLDSFLFHFSIEKFICSHMKFFFPSAYGDGYLEV